MSRGLMFVRAGRKAGRVNPAARVQRGKGLAATTALVLPQADRDKGGRKANTGREAIR